jgi:hypothetical protein
MCVGFSTVSLQACVRISVLYVLSLTSKCCAHHTNTISTNHKQMYSIQIQSILIFFHLFSCDFWSNGSKGSPCLDHIPGQEWLAARNIQTDPKKECWKIRWIKPNATYFHTKNCRHMYKAFLIYILPVCQEHSFQPISYTHCLNR